MICLENNRYQQKCAFKRLILFISRVHEFDIRPGCLVSWIYFSFFEPLIL